MPCTPQKRALNYKSFGATLFRLATNSPGAIHATSIRLSTSLASPTEPRPLFLRYAAGLTGGRNTAAIRRLELTHWPFVTYETIPATLRALGTNAKAARYDIQLCSTLHLQTQARTRQTGVCARDEGRRHPERRNRNYLERWKARPRVPSNKRGQSKSAEARLARHFLQRRHRNYH